MASCAWPVAAVAAHATLPRYRLRILYVRLHKPGATTLPLHPPHPPGQHQAVVVQAVVVVAAAVEGGRGGAVAVEGGRKGAVAVEGVGGGARRQGAVRQEMRC
jgi:hypothetical protein